MGEYDGPAVPEFFSDEVHSGYAVDFGGEEYPCPVGFGHGLLYQVFHAFQRALVTISVESSMCS